jgi:hypothetical protein
MGKILLGVEHDFKGNLKRQRTKIEKKYVKIQTVHLRGARLW